MTFVSSNKDQEPRTEVGARPRAVLPPSDLQAEEILKVHRSLVRLEERVHHKLSALAGELPDGGRYRPVPSSLRSLDPQGESGLCDAWHLWDGEEGQPSMLVVKALERELFTYSEERFVELVLEAPYSVLRLSRLHRGFGWGANDILMDGRERLLCSRQLAALGRSGDAIMARYITVRGVSLLVAWSSLSVPATRFARLKSELSRRVQLDPPVSSYQLLGAGPAVWAAVRAALRIESRSYAHGLPGDR